MSELPGFIDSEIKFDDGKVAEPIQTGLNAIQRQQVAQYVTNAFTTWHKPTVDLANQTAGVLDAIFLYAERVGFEVLDAEGKLIGTMHFSADQIAAWAMAQREKLKTDKQRKAEKAAGQEIQANQPPKEA